MPSTNKQPLFRTERNLRTKPAHRTAEEKKTAKSKSKTKNTVAPTHSPNPSKTIDKNRWATWFFNKQRCLKVTIGPVYKGPHKVTSRNRVFPFSFSFLSSILFPFSAKRRVWRIVINPIENDGTLYGVLSGCTVSFP